MPLSFDENKKIKEIIELVASDADSEKISKVLDLVTKSEPAEDEDEE